VFAIVCSIQTLWPHVSIALESVFLDAANRAIANVLPPNMFTSAELKVAKLGPIPPGVHYIRFMHTRNGDSTVRMELHLLWAGDPQVQYPSVT
jgi:hypothetical protein